MEDSEIVINKSNNIGVISNNNSSSSKECTQHNKPYEFICHTCNLILCSRCNNTHLKQFHDHNCDHIDDIRVSLDHLKLYSRFHNDENGCMESTIVIGSEDEVNNNNTNGIEGGDDSSDYIFKSRLNDIWKSIKKSSSEFRSLKLKENEINLFFKSLHEYLDVEEEKRKKPIIKDLDIIKNDIKQLTNELMSLVSIIDSNCNDNSNNINGSSINNNNIPDINSANILKGLNLEGDNTFDKYAIHTIIRSILESESLYQFLNKNNVLFTNYNNSNNNNNCNILESIQKHNTQFSNKLNHNYIDYTIKIDNDSLTDFKQNVRHIIRVKGDTHRKHDSNNNNNNNNNNSVITNNQQQQQQQQKQVPPPPLPKNVYILSTQSVGSEATLIDITNNQNIKTEYVRFDYHNNYTFNSMVTVGEHVYIFGGYDHDNPKFANNRFARFSIKSNTIDYESEFHNGVAGGNRISACYDGNEFIYLLTGYSDITSVYLPRVDRFSVKTMTFEPFGTFDHREYLISYYYNGKIYSLAINKKRLFVYDPVTKQIVEDYTNDKLFFCSRAVCHDGHGNLYIHSGDEKKFIRFNLNTKQIDKLTPTKVSICVSPMVFHRYSSPSSSSPSSFIYLFGGLNYGNYVYNVESNQWSKFFEDDQYDRGNLPSTLIFN